MCLRGIGIGIGIGISMQFYEDFSISARRQQGEHHRLRLLFQQKMHVSHAFPNPKNPSHFQT